MQFQVIICTRMKHGRMRRWRESELRVRIAILSSIVRKSPVRRCYLNRGRMKFIHKGTPLFHSGTERVSHTKLWGELVPGGGNSNQKVSAGFKSRSIRSHISQPLGSIVRSGSQRLSRHLWTEECEKGIQSREREREGRTNFGVLSSDTLLNTRSLPWIV